MDELASVIIVTYNSRHYLDACLRSVLRQDYPHEVILVDNCSQDGTVQYVRESFPEVKVIESPNNGGYGAGNNLGVRYARGKYAVILNPDVVVEAGWLQRLISPLQSNPMVIVTPKILLYDGSAINTCGNINNFTGLTFTRGLGADPVTDYCQVENVSGISGACFALRCEEYVRLGGFDESFFLYNEDADFSWRANLSGYSILSIPDSVIYHDYQLRVSPEKIYHLEKGRYLILRKYLSRDEFLLLLPSLMMAEVLTFGYAARFGFKGLKYKISALYDGFTANVHKLTGDKKALMAHLSPSIPEDQLTFTRVERLGRVFANKVLQWNFRAIR
jgi:GT2 family glycosyltransferase